MYLCFAGCVPEIRCAVCVATRTIDEHIDMIIVLDVERLVDGSLVPKICRQVLKAGCVHLWLSKNLVVWYRTCTSSI